ncbi:hypothetical protein [Streptomyces yangpuensis]|uniref:hypothetical protein n=1 Tax=Streptomyces yangpuensis TaxID=1648182 RepID=UPI00062989DA|nr:hypothetical protein [Streptomyces yangpuensis]
MRILRIHHTLPVLLLAGISCVAGPAHAAGPDFQYVGQDDRVHGLTAPRGCVAAEGGGGRAVTNATRGTAVLHQGPGCTGRVVGTLRAGEVTQVRPSFASVDFPVTR